MDGTCADRGPDNEDLYALEIEALYALAKGFP